MKLTPMLQLPSMVTGTWRRLGVHAFEGHVTLDDMTKIEASGEAWHKKNPGRVVEMVIIYPSDARMNAVERSRMAGLVKRWENARTASATVVLANGLAGSMHRSLLTGFQMIAPPPHPVKVFGAIVEATTWLTPHVQALCGYETTQADLLGAIHQLCEVFRPPALRVSEVQAGSAGFARRDEERPRPGR